MDVTVGKEGFRWVIVKAAKLEGSGGTFPGAGVILWLRLVETR